jgi:hypothetical protein
MAILGEFPLMCNYAALYVGKDLDVFDVSIELCSSCFLINLWTLYVLCLLLEVHCFHQISPFEERIAQKVFASNSVPVVDQVLLHHKQLIYLVVGVHPQLLSQVLAFLKLFKLLFEFSLYFFWVVHVFFILKWVFAADSNDFVQQLSGPFFGNRFEIGLEGVIFFFNSLLFLSVLFSLVPELGLFLLFHVVQHTLWDNLIAPLLLSLVIFVLIQRQSECFLERNWRPFVIQTDYP